MKTGKLSSLALAVFFIAVLCSSVFADWVVIDFEEYNPLRTQWIAGTGAGTQTLSISSAQAHTGSRSLLQNYVDTGTGSFPSISFYLDQKGGKPDLTGATAWRIWEYVDTDHAASEFTGWHRAIWLYGDNIVGNVYTDRYLVGSGEAPLETWFSLDYPLVNVAGANLVDCTVLDMDLDYTNGVHSVQHSGGYIDCYLDDITMLGATAPSAPGESLLADFETVLGSPPPNAWGTATVVGTATLATSLGAPGGSQSVLWRLDATGLGGVFPNEWPNLDIYVVGGGSADMTGATQVETWFYWDFVRAPIPWGWLTTDCYVMAAAGVNMGGWNIGNCDIQTQVWHTHLFNITLPADLTAVTSVRWNLGNLQNFDGLELVDGILDVYIDDVSFIGATLDVEDWMLM